MIFNICSRLGAVLLGILTIFKKALCCFSRRRKRSNSECEVLNVVSVVQGDGTNTFATSSTNRNNEVSIATENYVSAYSMHALNDS